MKRIEQSVQPEYRTITSVHAKNYFTKEHVTSQIERIKQASDLAEKKVDYDTAHNDDILYAIQIVEQFLRKTHRICYGGQAINAHLPTSHKIYDPMYSIPDYDFFTPSPAKDIEYLTNLLKRAGFKEISTREGMHEGTMKVYVDYVPVADITAIHPKIFDSLYKKSAEFNGIHYMDANSLRMLMYLELSRPRGEVERWSKVFERLMMFNEFVPMKRCTSYEVKPCLTPDDVSMIIRFIIQKKRVFAGADLIDFYHISRKSSIPLDITTKKPILFYSSNSYQDAVALASTLQSSKKRLKILSIAIQKSDLIPYCTIIKEGKQILVCIIEYSACHSYITTSLKTGGTLMIASLDTLITLYFSLGLIHKQMASMGSMECMASRLVEISIRSRNKPNKLPFISIECMGYQKTLPSLIREKVERITRKRTNEKRKTNKKRN